MTDADDAVACRTCREPIRRGAKKCVRCDSYQDWRGLLSIGTSTLALLVALVSVSAAAAPTLKEVLMGARSRVEVGYQTTVDDGLLFLVENSGTRPAVVVGASAPRPDFLWARLRREGDRGWYIVQPGEVKFIQVQLDVSYNPDAYRDFMSSDEHQVQIFVRNFGGEGQSISFDIPRSDLLRTVIEGHECAQARHLVREVWSDADIEQLIEARGPTHPCGFDIREVRRQANAGPGG